MFKRTVKNRIAIEKVDLVRATLNEAFEMRDNLTEDILDYNRIIVDLTNCDYIDSTFLGVLVYSYKKIKEKGGIMVLVTSNTFLSTSFLYQEISSIFRVYQSINAAIEAVNTDTKNVSKTKEPAKIVQTHLQLD